MLINKMRSVRLSKASLGLDEQEAVLRPLKNAYLGMGQEVKLFEYELSDYFARDVACVVNGTAALHLALQACGIGSGDEVLVPSLTYVAAFQAIKATGAKPVACDIYPNTCMLDIDDASRRLSARTRAIMPLHYGGAICELDRIYTFSKKFNLRTIEDAAHAFGSTYNDELVGKNGDIVCFSFDGIKNITAGEGGCIVTSDQKILKLVRDSRLLGVENDSLARFSGQRSWEFDVSLQGWRYHMSDIMAAIGRTQLKRRSELAERRNKLATRYQRNLLNIDGLKIILENLQGIVPHIFPISIEYPFDRNCIRQKLNEVGIQTGIHYFPNHFLSYFVDGNSSPLPVTEKIWKQLISLPLHPDLDEDDIDYVSDQLIRLLQR